MTRQVPKLFGTRMGEPSPLQRLPEIYRSSQGLMAKSNESLVQVIREISRHYLGHTTALYFWAPGQMEKYYCGRRKVRKYWLGNHAWCLSVLYWFRSSYIYSKVISIAWHPQENLVSFVTSEGELFIYADFVPTNCSHFLEKSQQPSPFIHDPLSEISGNTRNVLTNGYKDHHDARDKRRGTPDSLDDILGPDPGIDEDNFVSDDDGAGYLDEINDYGKRSNGHLDPIEGFESRKRPSYHAWQPKLHRSFQPGSTPWRGNRKYLCELNCRILVNHSWSSVRSESHWFCVDCRSRYS